MRIENDIKLGFKDVMIRPKRSTLKSRAEVSLERNFKFMHGGTWQGIPVMAANMDTVGTFEMADALATHQLFTAAHKHYTPAQWLTYLATKDEAFYNNIALSTGTSKNDSEKLATVLSQNSLKNLFVFMLLMATQRVL